MCLHNRLTKPVLAALLLGFALSAAAAEEYIFTAPPRDDGGSEADVYEPVATRCARGPMTWYSTARTSSPGAWPSYSTSRW